VRRCQWRSGAAAGHRFRARNDRHANPQHSGQHRLTAALATLDAGRPGRRTCRRSPREHHCNSWTLAVEATPKPQASSWSSPLFCELSLARQQAQPTHPRRDGCSACWSTRYNSHRNRRPSGRSARPAAPRCASHPRSRMTVSLTLSELGRMVGSGERTLSRLFHNEIGMGFTVWRNQLRLIAPPFC
jgi:AraC-like DNA-binding protein